jgi:general nucleoside transport system permease protein
MSLWTSIVSLGFVAAVVRIAIPYVFAAIGGSLVERSGVVDLALEAKLLCGAFAAASVTHATGSLSLGIVAGSCAGAAVSALQALCALRLGANPGLRCKRCTVKEPTHHRVRPSVMACLPIR